MMTFLNVRTWLQLLKLSLFCMCNGICLFRYDKDLTLLPLPLTFTESWCATETNKKTKCLSTLSPRHTVRYLVVPFLMSTTKAAAVYVSVLTFANNKRSHTHQVQCTTVKHELTVKTCLLLKYTYCSPQCPYSTSHEHSDNHLSIAFWVGSSKIHITRKLSFDSRSTK